MQTSFWTARRVWIIRVCIFVFIAGIARISFAVFPFALELSKESLDRTIRSTYGTTPWALIRDAAVVAYVAWKIGRHWGAEEAEKYLRNGKYVAEALGFAFLLTFLYHIIFTLPREIRADSPSKTIAVFATPKLIPPSFWAMEAPCGLSVAITTEMIARVYAREKLPETGETINARPFIQELFYEWTLSLKPNRTVSDVEVDLRYGRGKEDEMSSDHLRSVPIGVILDPKPGWMSGFDEPAQRPDYYTRSIHIAKLERNRRAKVIIRHSIKFIKGMTNFVASDFERSFNLSVPTCRFNKPILTIDNKRFLSLMRRGFALAQWKYFGLSGPDLPVKLNPDDPLPPLEPNEAESTFEMRCKDDTCKKATISQLEVRVQRPK
jgi:hypothetical protein